MGTPLSFSLKNKIVVVVGAGRGIGKSIAETCAAQGADLALGSRTVAESIAVAEHCRASGIRAEAWPLDIAQIPSMHTFVDSVLAHYGRIDVLVNNAGTNMPKPALDYSEEEYDQIMDTNLKGVFFLTTIVGRSMIDQQIEGSVITITSQAGVVGAPLRSIYSASKSGAAALMRTLAAEWAPHKITVNAVAPTFTRTPLLEKALTNPAFARNLEKIPMGRIAEPEEIAAAVAFLASPAARMITGQELCVDGGFTAV